MSRRLKTASFPAWASHEASKHRRHIIAALVLGLAATGFAALLMFTAGYLIARTAQSGTTLFIVMVPIAFVQLFGIGRPVARYLERLVSHDWVFRTTSDLRLELFRAIERSSKDPGRSLPTGDYLNMLADDIGHLQNLFLRVALPVAIAWSLFVVASVFCCAFAWQIGVLLLVIGVVCALLLPIAAFLLTRALELRGKSMRHDGYESLADDIMGIADWTLACRNDEASRAHEGSRNALQACGFDSRRRLRFVELSSALFCAAGACAVLLAASSLFGGDSSSSDLIAAFALGFFPLVETSLLLPAALVSSTEHQASVAHLDEALGDAPSTQTAYMAEQENPSANPVAQGAISLVDVSYRYPGAAAPAINHLTLTIPAGQKVAVLGRSGAGKSTLAALLRGAVKPDHGSVLLGDTPVNDLGHPAHTICFVPQEPFIFDRTLRENLLMGREDATDEQLASALENVGLGKKLSDMPNGLDSHIGETGTGFSGGEAQRIALARALLSQAPIVVFDEPFCALDPAMERQLVATLFEAFEDKTLIVVTHHLLEIERFDRVVFVESGSIQMDGSPHNLACDEPHFRQLLEFDRGSLPFTSIAQSA